MIDLEMLDWLEDLLVDYLKNEKEMKGVTTDICSFTWIFKL